MKSTAKLNANWFEPAVNEVIWRLFFHNTAKIFWFATGGGCDLCSTAVNVGILHSCVESGDCNNASSAWPRSPPGEFLHSSDIFYQLAHTLSAKQRYQSVKWTHKFSSKIHLTRFGYKMWLFSNRHTIRCTIIAIAVQCRALNSQKSPPHSV